MKDFIKIMGELAYRHSISQVFDDFLTMAVCCYSVGRMEKIYLETISRYSKEEAHTFAKALAAFNMAYCERLTEEGGWYDGLGEFFEEHNSKFGRDAAGQFFTPPHICDLMAQMSWNDEVTEGNVGDPACGSGRNLLAFDRLNPQNRFRFFYVAQDVDRRCALMCTLNMFMHGMRGIVVHGDTLRMQAFGGYRIWLPETGLFIQPMTAEAAQQVMENPFELKQPEPVIEKEPPPPREIPRQLRMNW